MAASGELIPYFSFGVIADVQYADKDDGAMEGRVQRYREADSKLRAAIDEYQNHPEQLSCVVVLGDTIDGRGTLDESMKDLEHISTILDGLGQIPVCHIVGNHDLAVTRQAFCGTLRLSRSYYTYELAPGWLLVVLDTTELSTGSGYPEDSVEMAESRAFAASHPVDQYPHMQDWNGGMASQQVKWLKEVLHEAESHGQRVVVACHHPLSPGAGRMTHLAWNWEEIRGILLASHAVVLVMHGHDHVGGHACVDEVHFVTFEAMLEAPTHSNAYAFVRVFPDHLHIRGVGSVSTRKLRLPDRLIQVT